MAPSVRWSETDIKRALYLYFQIPFGQIHSGNPEIISLAYSLKRTPSSVAMKLANFASLDPIIQASGRKGLQGASSLDRKIWNEFHTDWTGLVLEVGSEEVTHPPTDDERLKENKREFRYIAPNGETTARAEVELRIGQGFFRRAVLANFDNACCVTGISDTRLLVASHISPWQLDIPNRHNPRNGLCLSATFDRAFDRHLMTVAPDLTVKLSAQLTASHSPETRNYFIPYQGIKLRMPTHLTPDPDFLLAHNELFAD